MKTHRWILHAAIQARTDPLAWAARGILILALVLGSLGAVAAASSGYGSGDHASAHQPAGNNRLAASSGHIIDVPWMY
jgi:hypothetical protein